MTRRKNHVPVVRHCDGTNASWHLPRLELQLSYDHAQPARLEPEPVALGECEQGRTRHISMRVLEYPPTYLPTNHRLTLLLPRLSLWKLGFHWPDSRCLFFCLLFFLLFGVLVFVEKQIIGKTNHR